MHLVVILGPPASGKMTVGAELAAATGYKLFHNHLSIDPILGIFDHGTASFARISKLIRQTVIEEAVASDLPGLIFTLVWALDLPEDAAYVEDLVAPVREAGGRVDFVELTADQETRLGREGTAYRLEHKKPQRDVDWARGLLVALDEAHRFQTDGTPLPVDAGIGGHVVVDNSGDDPADTALRIAHLLGL